MGEDATDLQALERFVVDNDELLELEAKIGRFNIFDALGIARAEIRHSNFLAWLLDPAESHGQGSLFLKAILIDMASATHAALTEQLQRAQFTDVCVSREQEGCDILISSASNRLVVVLENKVGSKEGMRHGRSQLVRYEEVTKRRFAGCRTLLAYLTIEGTPPSRAGWLAYSYTRLRRVLSETMAHARRPLRADVAVLLNHYVETIGRIGPWPDATDNRLVRAIEAKLKAYPAWHVFGDYRTSGYQRFHYVPSTWDEPGAELLPAIGRDAPFQRHWLYGWCGVRRQTFSEPSLSIEFWCANTRDNDFRARVLDAIINISHGEFRWLSADGNWVSLYRRDVHNWQNRCASDNAGVVREAVARIDELGRVLAGVPDALRPIIAEWEAGRKADS